MPHDRFYLNDPLVEGQEVIIEGDEFHHLSRVMRGQVGDELEGFNGKGQLASLQITSLEKKEGRLLVLKSTYTPPASCPLIIAQAYTRQNKLDYILEKGCELGMQILYLFPGERSEKSETSDNQKIRMRHILESASKQCGQLWIPEIILLPPLKQWKSLEYPSFYGDVRASAPSFSVAWHKSQPQQGAVFFVGPEKGFSENETVQLEKLGAVGVSLHRHILRAETAPLAALSLMSHWLMTE